jgi:hypothetical protein
VPVGFPFQVVASVLPGLSYLPDLRLVTELVHSVGRPFVAQAELTLPVPGHVFPAVLFRFELLFLGLKVFE